MNVPRGVTVSSLAIVLSFVFLQPARAQAQPAPAQNSCIGVGALGMVGWPSITNTSATFDAKTSYGVGLWVGGNKGGRVGFTGEFIYVWKKFEDPSAEVTEVKRQALEIPAVFHINFGSHTKSGALGYGIIGPVFTINVKDKLTGGLGNENFSSADIGIMAGAGFEVARIGIEGRGNWGMKSITDENDGALEDNKEFSFELVGKVRFN